MAFEEPGKTIGGCGCLVVLVAVLALIAHTPGCTPTYLLNVTRCDITFPDVSFPSSSQLTVKWENGTKKRVYEVRADITIYHSKTDAEMYHDAVIFPSYHSIHGICVPPGQGDQFIMYPGSARIAAPRLPGMGEPAPSSDPDDRASSAVCRITSFRTDPKGKLTRNLEVRSK